MDFGAFDELTAHIENTSSTIRVFGSFECLSNETTQSTSNKVSLPTAAADGERKIPAASIVVLGDKVILQNFKKQDEKKETIKYVEYEEVTGAENVPILNTTSSKLVSKASSGTMGGTIVFHIDNTSSMIRDKRMELTKDVMRRVIPNFLRQGFKIIVNAWASTNENHGKVQTREVNPDIALLQALMGVQEAGAEDCNPLQAEAKLHDYLNSCVFDILVPKGRTDLYGSCFQLLQQCKKFLERENIGPIFAFVLTDGEHNKLDCPLHQPSAEGETYFGVYHAISLTPGKSVADCGKQAKLLNVEQMFVDLKLRYFFPRR